MQTNFLDNLKLTLSPENAQMLLACQKLIKEKCSALKDIGDVYFERAYNTANYLCSLNLDVNTIIAGFLHGFYTHL